MDLELEQQQHAMSRRSEKSRSPNAEATAGSRTASFYMLGIALRIATKLALQALLGLLLGLE